MTAAAPHAGHRTRRELVDLPSTPRVTLRQKLSRAESWGVRIATIVVFAVVWEVGARWTDSLLMPTFLEAMAALWEIAFVTGEMWPALARSNVALLIGYPVAVLIAVPLGLAMARWKSVDRAFGPITAVSLSLPIAPLIPVVLVAMGLGLTPRVFIIVLFSWVFITTNVRAGVRAVDHTLVEMAGSYGASESQLWRRVLIPGAFPAIMTGLRTGLGRAFAGMIIVELIMLPIGIGSLMLDYRGFFQADKLYALTIAVAVEGIVLALVMQAFERRAQRWK
ncbi:ABC transporter permease [Georgenia sp. Z1344]|uniref:ABC transporter permease n=1 Tax=Georgenia sp. Z1344 TaxID=3416706 RepID=UPI003CF5126E